MKSDHCYRIVLTGGPGAGKTTAADLYRRELGESLVIVPEAATILYRGGFPRDGEGEVLKETQRTIYELQKGLEEVQAKHYCSRILLCDRGTIDGAAYWPDDAKDFFNAMGTTIEDEYDRYDAVIFFETAAVGGISIEGGNPARVESTEEAVALDRKLRDLWSRHPGYIFVPHHASFLEKINTGLVALRRVMQRVRN